MRITTRLNKSEIANRLSKSVYTTDAYGEMKWHEKYHCEKCYYGDVSEDRFDLCMTNSNGERTGTQHLFFRGKVVSDGCESVITVSVVPNFNHILLVVLSVVTAIYVVYSGKSLLLLVSLGLIIIDIISIISDYYSFRSFIEKELKQE